ncbi:MAG: hypothetical protein PWQ17_1919 [Anaerophaga sp.]|nr:hypothetical protein [Anaerophaga sp.]
MVSKLFLFNPTNELAIANGQVSYMPPANLRRFENDLASLPWILSDEDDYILVSYKEGNSLKHLSDHGWKMPSLVTSPEEIPEEVRLIFSPWGWSPAVYNKLKHFYHLAAPQWHTHPFARWNKNSAQLLSRETGYALLKEIELIKRNYPDKYGQIEIPYSPVEINSIAQLSEEFQKTEPPALIKTQWSASGRGLFKIRDEKDNPVASDWIKGMLKRQGKLFIEQMLPKIQDVSFQFMIDDEIEYIGHNYFYTDSSGQFAGCAIGRPENASSYFKDQAQISAALHQGAEIVRAGLIRTEINKSYKGPAGVDGLFFINKQKEMKLQPCLEINLRYNMGIANIRLQKRIHPGARGTWKTGLFKQEKWQTFCKNKIMTNPPAFEKGKLRKGFLPIVNPYVEKLFGAWIEVE